MLENHVAQYKERHIICKTCNGEGTEHLTHAQIYEIMEHSMIERAVNLYVRWRVNDGMVYCFDCDGTGEFSIRY